MRKGQKAGSATSAGVIALSVGKVAAPRSWAGSLRVVLARIMLCYNISVKRRRIAGDAVAAGFRLRRLPRVVRRAVNIKPEERGHATG